MPVGVFSYTRGFRNNYQQADPGLRDLIRWRFGRKAPPKPQPFPLTSNDPAALRANRTRPALTWVGHSTFLAQLEGVNFLTDPIFSDRASPLPFGGTKRVTPVGLPMADLPHIDCVLVSHNHYDHLDAPSVKALQRKQADNPPLFVVPAKLGAWFRRRGFPRVVELDWWEHADVNGSRVQAVPVQHWSQRIPFIVNHTRWTGFVIEGRHGRLFFPGDTGYSRDFTAIRDRLGPMTVSLLPIGAYEPRWFMRPMHIGPEEAVRIHQDLESKLSVAMHFGTFCQTDEPFDEPPQQLRAAMQATGLTENTFWILGHGETRWLDELWR